MTSQPRPPRRPGLSLEYRLPLLITALLAVVMAAGVLFAYTEVKQFAVESARQRLELIAQQLAGIVEPGLPRRLAVVEETAADPAVVAFFAAPGEETGAAAEAALGALRGPAQEELPILLLGPGGETLLQAGDYPVAPPAGASPPGPLPDSTGISPFFQIGPRSFFWMAAAVRGGGRDLGLLAELRPVGGTGTAEQVEALIGSDFAVFFANTAGGSWIRLDGEAVPAPAPWPFVGAARYRAGEEGDHFAHADEIGGTAFSMVATVPLTTVLQRPALFLRRGALAVLLLLLAGAAAAWALSRGVTRPVTELRLASEALARGEYGRRIDSRRSDELGILADAFDAMAARVQATHQELTHHYEAAQALAGELEQASRAKSEFLATMSHEIRTPINAIIGYTDLFQLGLSGPVTEAQEKQLERIRTSGRHLMSLVDQVLDFARVESGTLRLERRAASVGESIETALTVLRPQAAEKGVALSAECEPDADLRYLGDPQRVDQILVNLLSNAIKFSEPGTRTSIRCGSCEGRLPADGTPGRWTCLVVEDRGVGIPEEQMVSIFEPFVQLESGYTRRFGGTGLGLAISLRLARSMGGDLTVESEPGTGSRFTLWLPTAVPGASPASTAGRGAHPAAGAARGP